jgi:hypothetical protein
MNNELSTFSLEPRTLKEAQDYAVLIANSEMVPKDYIGKPGNVLVAVQMGAEIGLKPLQALQNIAVINGRPSIWGDALIAIVRNSPSCEYVKESFDNNSLVATCKVKRKGHDEEVRTFSKADAETAGLWSKAGPWKQYPKRMLQMRARAFALRDVFGDLLRGLSVAEEASDIIDVTPNNGNVEDDAPDIIETYKDDDFDKNFPAWKKIVESGKKSKQDLIMFIESKGSLLTDEQKKKINALNDPEIAEVVA